MAIFVINEWLWHDSSGDNGEDAQKEAFKVLQGLAASNHQIVVIEGSPFDQKALKLCKTAHPMLLQLMGRHYMAGVRLNSDRCRLVKAGEAASLPAELSSAIKADDQYLMQSLLSVDGAVLVTTDQDLCKAVTRAGRICISREDFLIRYF